MLQAFASRGKPVLGVCRGLQLMNVAFGGTLLQDIDTQRPGAVRHRDAGLYDRNVHEVEFVAGTRLAEVFSGLASATVNSVHHQASRTLRPASSIEARCPSDGMIEAIRKPGAATSRRAMAPRVPPPRRGTLDDRPLLDDFLDAARAARAS
jgi:putative glutamine amidotransferase